MRIYASCDFADVLVIAEPFAIEASGERFGVHRAIGTNQDREEWTASHAETGFRVGGGDTLDQAIEAARRNWTSRTPGQIEDVLSVARSVRQARATQNREVLQ